MTTNDTTATSTPWPTRDQVITALGTVQDREDLHPNWRSVLGRLRQDAEWHTALRAAVGGLPTRQVGALCYLMTVHSSDVPVDGEPVGFEHGCHGGATRAGHPPPP